MSQELHRRASELFARVRRLAEQDRASALAELCGGDRALRGEVESLLRHHEAGTDFLDTPALGESVAAALGGASPRLDAGERVAGFRVLGVLGEGGMGVVYRAEQERPHRAVALKMLRFDLATERARRRFEREGELLARLRHPGIAQVFETGADRRGRPYIAMELVEGEPIHAFARSRALSVGARLGLLAQACDAVQHAHQRGVIHRDLKPANVLVEDGADTDAAPRSATGPLVPGGGRVKVLDFGVARALGEEAEATMCTGDGQLVGTLRSMSPEQLSGEPDAVDARADVYALGVLGYELLADAHPFADLRGGLAEVSAALRQREPRRLGMVSRALRGDVETIIARAMEKDPSRRYQSAGEMAADIRRHLASEPILARRPTAAYHLRKLAVRHKAAAAAAALAVLASGGGVAGVGWQAMRATRAERAARQQLEIADEQTRTAEAVSAFLRSILASGDPRNTDNPGITVKQALDNAAAGVGERFAEQPVVEASIRRVIGDTYRSLGFPLEALPHMEQAERLFSAGLDEHDPRRLRAVGDLAILYKSLNRLDDAEPLFKEDLRLRRLTDGARAEETLVAEVNLARLHLAMGRWDEGARSLRETLGAMRAALGDENTNTIVTMQHLAGAYIERRRLEDAEPLLAGAIAAWRRIGEPRHPYALVAAANLSSVYEGLGEDERALEMRREALAIARETLGETHPTTMGLLSLEAQMLRKLGRPAEAIGPLRGAIAELESRLAPDDRLILSAMGELTLSLAAVGRHEEALAASTELIERARRGLPAGHPYLADHLTAHAANLRSVGRDADAEPFLEEALVIDEEAYGPDHAKTRRAAARLGELYTVLGRDDLAADLRERYPGEG